MTRYNVVVAENKDGTGTTVTIHSAKIEYNYVNDIWNLQIPSLAEAQKTLIKNLLRIKEVWTITGHLTATASKTDDELKIDLRTIFFQNQNTSKGVHGLSFDNESTWESVGFMKLMIIEEAVDEATTTPAGSTKYLVTLQAIEGDTS